MATSHASLYQSLEWLPSVDQGTMPALEDALESKDNFLHYTQRQLSEPKLSKLVKKCNSFPKTPDFLAEKRLAILSNANYEMLGKVIEGGCLQHGFKIEFALESMGRIGAAAYDPSSVINTQPQDVVVIALTHHHFFQPNLIGKAQDATAFLDSVFSDIAAVGQVQKNNGGKLLVQSVPHGGPSLLGAAEKGSPGSPAFLIAEFNARLREENYVVLDTESLAQNIGAGEWSSDHYWFWAKFPFHPKNNIAYANRLGRAIAVSQGGTKKCLILDLDNTVWGGVIGDDGMDGIEIGNNSPNGEAHLAIQAFALALKSCGVVLAVCSKNTYEVAIEPFQSHSEMLLREDDIAIFQANWHDKASNIRAIAQELSLGMDSFVFLDDNPMERDLVRQELPEVSVPEVDGKNPASWLSVISAAGYFDSLGLTETDKNRAEQYTANKKRKQIEVKSKDITSYLRELEMELIVSGFDPSNRSRVSQLINRSNQFNLTTQRYSESDVQGFESDTQVVDLAFRLKDKFGDNGIIAIIIGRINGQKLIIDTWLMSCRVLKRNVEQACLDHVVSLAKAANLTEIVGDYLPTRKNDMVKDHYRNLGFSKPSHAPEGEGWCLTVEDYTPANVVISINDQK